MKIFKLFLTTVLFLVLSACTIPQYKWVNNIYAPAMVEENLVVDQGDCNADASAAFPLPLSVQTPNNVYRQCMRSPFARKQVIVAPDYAAYVNNSPDLRSAYANRQDKSLNVEAWGKQRYQRIGRPNGARIPAKQIVTYPVCDEIKVYQQYKYDEYLRIVSTQRSYRSEHVSNCMALLGWQYIRVEDIPPRLITEWHTNGQKSKEGNMVNSQPEGLWTEWDEGGNVVSQGNYLKGKKDGPWVEYDHNGQIELARV